MLVSKKLGINENSKINMELYDRYHRNPYNVDELEFHEMLGLGEVLVTLAKKAQPDDLIAVRYVSQIYHYYCTHASWADLPVGVKNDLVLSYHKGYNAPIHHAALQSVFEDCNHDFISDLENVVKVLGKTMHQEAADFN